MHDKTNLIMNIGLERNINCIFNIFLGQTPTDQVGVGIFYNNRRTRRLTGTFDTTIDLNMKKRKSSCSKCS